MAPLVSSLGIPDSHPDGKPANGGHGRLFWHGPASPSLAWPRCALGGALMKLPSSPTPAAACAMQPSSLTRLARPCLAALTCFEFHRGQVQNELGPQATLLHPPCTNPMASPLWVDGRWMGDLKEPAGGGRGGSDTTAAGFYYQHLCAPSLRSPSCVPVLSIPILIFTHPLLPSFSSQVGLYVWELEPSGCSLIPPASRFTESPLRETPCPSCATRRPRCAAGPIRTSLGA